MNTMFSPHEVSFSEVLLMRSLITQARRPNMLVVCSDTDIRRTFERVHDLGSAPFSFCLLPGRLDLPTSGRGTLLLHDVAALTLDQQIALYDWLSAKGQGVQVVSMSSSPLLPLVQAGRFLEGLFYRLNTISIVAKAD